MEEIRSDEEMRQILSSRLKTIMRERDINQRELAYAIGVSESTIGKWILKKAMPRMGIIQKLADFFKVGKSFFLEKNPPINADRSDRFKDSLSSDETNLVRGYRKLPLNKKNLVWEFVRALNSSDAQVAVRA